MSIATHYENAHFLRQLAERLPKLMPEGKPSQVELLQRLANEELAQAEYDEWVKGKVAAARADSRPGVTTDQLRQQLKALSQDVQRGL